MGQLLVTGPAAEPVSLADAKNHCKVEVAADDGLLGALIVAARDQVETITRRQLVTATWKVTHDAFPAGDLVPPHAPLVSVSSVVYTDQDGVSRTLASSAYQVVSDEEPGRVVELTGFGWPQTDDVPGAVALTYIAGHATPFTADATTDVLTALGRTLANNDKVRLSNSGGALPGGLVTLTDYYVVQSAGTTFKLSLTQGGAAVDLLSNGSGTHFLGEVPEGLRQAIRLLVGHWYLNREAAAATRLEHLPLAVQFLLKSHWTGEYV